MKRTWTPWRMDYILGIRAEDGCVFCRDVLSGESKPDLVIHRGSHSFVVMNLYPYAVGHLMVVPVRHVAHLPDLTGEEIDEMTRQLQKAERVVGAVLGQARQQVGINIGRCAGAGVEGHLHIHLVPIDSDSVEVETDRLSEPITTTRDRLLAGWDQPEGFDRRRRSAR